MKHCLILAVVLGALSCASSEPKLFANDILGSTVDVTTDYEMILKGEIDPSEFTEGDRMIRINQSEELRASVTYAAEQE